MRDDLPGLEDENEHFSPAPSCQRLILRRLMAQCQHPRPVQWPTSPNAVTPSSVALLRPGAGVPCSSAGLVGRLASLGRGQQTPSDPSARPFHHGVTARPTACFDQSTSPLPCNQRKYMRSSQKGMAGSSVARSCPRGQACRSHNRLIRLKEQ